MNDTSCTSVKETVLRKFILYIYIYKQKVISSLEATHSPEGHRCCWLEVSCQDINKWQYSTEICYQKYSKVNATQSNIDSGALTVTALQKQLCIPGSLSLTLW